MTAQQQFETFLKKYDPAVAYEGKKCLAKLRKLVPGAIEMVYDNYNFLVVGSCPMDDSYVRTLIGHALKRAKVGIPIGQKRQFIIKSVSAKQRPRRPAKEQGAHKH